MKPHIIVIMIALFVVGVTIGHVSALPNRSYVVKKCPAHLVLAKSLFLMKRALDNVCPNCPKE